MPDNGTSYNPPPENTVTARKTKRDYFEFCRWCRRRYVWRCSCERARARRTA